MKRTVLLLIHFLGFSFSILMAQSNKGTIKGRILSADGNPAAFVPVGLKNTKTGILTDENGNYEFKVPAGKYTLLVQFIGHEPEEKEIEVKEGETHTVTDFTLRESSKELQEVEVTGKTEIQNVQQQAFNVSTVDAKKLHNTTLDLSSALNRVSGVRVRESGGVGSDFNFSLNGFTGRQVKFFMDGVPMDNFGSSFQINNIPINLAERIEVYKGVVPVWLGADALGGAVNIITNPNKSNYLDASYSYGSFNTHRSSVNTGYTSKKGITAQLSLFQNYSDNNYWVEADVADLKTGLMKKKRVRRFHDTYRNETAIFNIGVRKKKYADVLMIGITIGQNKADIQTGARMLSVFGDFYRRGNTIMPTVRYFKNDLFLKGLSLSLTGNFNLGQEQNVDTVARRYNWQGEYTPTAGPGSERSRTLYKFHNNNGIATGNLGYRINNRHSVVFNNVFSTFNRKGENELTPDNIALKQPKKTQKNIIGLGYKYDFNKRWSTSLFVKRFHQRNTSSLASQGEGGWGTTVYKERSFSFDNTGYGIASTYFLFPSLQSKASYEKSYRLPENEELFGDEINLQGNLSLKPETSHNFNFGLTYSTAVKKVHNIMVEGNMMYRKAEDFIRPSLSPNNTHQVMTNQRDVTNLGFNGDLRYSFKRLFRLGANLSYQNVRNNTKYEEGSTQISMVYQDRMPNLPFLFGHADASVSFHNVGAKGNSLSFGYNLLFVYQYYLRWPSQGGRIRKPDIPTQIAHDVNIVYTLANGRYNIALECKNLTDSRLYDNFSLQKPSRGFYIKLRYFLSK